MTHLTASVFVRVRKSLRVNALRIRKVMLSYDLRCLFGPGARMPPGSGPPGRALAMAGG